MDATRDASEAAAEPPGGGRALRIAVEGAVADLSPDERERLLRRRPDDEPGLRDTVAGLMDEVRERGDAALVEMAERFDGVRLETLEVPRERWEDALDRLEPEVRSALEQAADRVAAFHRAQIPEDVKVQVSPGVILGRRSVPLRRVGVYAPGGRAAYPSSVLMGVVPARVAGVGEIVVCSPPGPSGEPSAEVLAAATIGGATRLFAVGGAGAVAGLAFGTESVPRVDAVVGPGNRWVTEAKRQVAGDLVIDAPAGPSEVLVVADDTADPRRVAAELVAQAEHDPEAAVALVTHSASLLEAVRSALAEEVAAAPRRDVVEAALAGRGALLLAIDRDEALRFAEAYAAEHLALYTEDPRRDLEGVTTAGTVFLGDAASVAFGDYLTGANHVLPTAGLARSFSGLSVLHFLRFFTWQDVTAEAAEGMAGPTATLARAEGLPGHARAAELRLPREAQPGAERASGAEDPAEGGARADGPTSALPRSSTRGGTR